MLTGFFLLILFLALGQSVQLVTHAPIPGAIFGMGFMLLALSLYGRIPDNLKQISQSLTPLLPLFIIPVSVGLITQQELIEQHGLKLLVILTLCLIPGTLVTALIMRLGKPHTGGRK